MERKLIAIDSEVHHKIKQIATARRQSIRDFVEAMFKDWYAQESRKLVDSREPYAKES